MSWYDNMSWHKWYGQFRKFWSLKSTNFIEKSELLSAQRDICIHLSGCRKFILCYTPMTFYHLYSCLASTLERQKWHTAITDLEATVLHGVASHCNHTFIYCTEYFSHVIICEFSSCIPTNYMENVLMHAWTVDTRHSSPIFFKCLRMRLFYINYIYLCITTFQFHCEVKCNP